jgi:hypothetical protein
MFIINLKNKKHSHFQNWTYSFEKWYGGSTKIRFPYEPAMILLVIYTRDMNMVLKRQFHIHVHTSIVHHD